MAGKASLIFVVGFSVIMAYIILNLTSLGTRATENMSWYNAATSSKNLATIGANAGLARLHADTTLSGTILDQTISEGSYSGGRFTVTVTPSSSDLRLVSVAEHPVATFQTLRDTIEVLLRVRTVDDFEMYAWLTDFPGNDQFFFTGDTIWGPLHANGQIHIHNGAPVFHGHVSARGTNPRPGVPANQAKFLGGLTTGASDVLIPNSYDQLVDAANNGGLSFTGDTWLRYYDTEIHVYHSEPSIVDMIFPSPDEVFSVFDFNGAIFVDGNVYVQGTIEHPEALDRIGTVTVGASNNVNITGNITYKTDPAYLTTNIGIVEGIMRQEHEGLGNELLGFVAGNNVIIKDTPFTAMNNQHVTIHGVVLAMGHIEADIIHNSKSGVLDVWGSMIQASGRARLRSPNNQAWGFQQLYKFDTRLGGDDPMRPPFFPGFYRPAGFSILSWYESIQLPPF
jgi:hypothetical protein